MFVVISKDNNINITVRTKDAGMVKRSDDLERCLTCENMNQDESNKNWIVCPKMTIDVVTTGKSEDCENYESIKAQNQSND